MAIAQPSTTDPLNSPDHSKLHRVVGVDTGADDESLNIDANNTVTTAKGGRIVNTTRYTTTQTVAVTDHVLFCDTDGGAWTLSLPAGVEGTNYKIINCGSSGFDLTVDPDGSEQLFKAGAGVASILADGEVINIHYNATEGWR